MTTMCLRRARIFKEIGGLNASVLTFARMPMFEGILRSIRASGHLSNDVNVLNVYEHYRAADLCERPAIVLPWTSSPMPEDAKHELIEDTHGQLYCRVTKDSSGESILRREFFRTDGSVFLQEDLPNEGSSSTRLSMISSDGNIVMQFSAAWEFYHYWMAELTQGQSTAFIVDSAYASRFVRKFELQHAIKMFVIHNPHVKSGADPLRAPLGNARKEALEDTSVWDGIVFLTERQREDFVLRFGNPNNLFQISNPSDRLPQLPAFEERSTRRGVMVARLAPQKNIEAAIEVMGLVVDRVPDVQLDVYGDGPLRADLQAQIERYGLEENVFLRGHQENAATEFDSARFSLLTSVYEGQGLVVLESLGRGCPPISFDIRYGPSDCIEDGQNGFLIAPGDSQTAAERIVELCRETELARQLGENAWASSGRFGSGGVLESWMKAITLAWQQRSTRIGLSDLTAHPKSLRISSVGDITIVCSVAWNQHFGPAAGDHLIVRSLVVPRKTGTPLSSAARVLNAGDGWVETEICLFAHELSTSASAGTELDMFLVIEGGNVARSLRVQAKILIDDNWLAYSTVNGNLSLKFTGDA